MTSIDRSHFRHQHVLRLAVPLIIANISTPLLGIVDTAVMGHLNEDYVGAIAMGSLLFSFIFWGFGFLRMGTSGLTAQAYGQQDQSEMEVVLARSLLIAGSIAIFLLIFRVPLKQFSFWLLEPPATVDAYSKIYFDIRIWSAPGTLLNYSLIGWFVGLQKVKASLAIVLITNMTNIVLDLLLVNHYHMAIDGVAYASVIAEYTGFFIGLWLVFTARTQPTVSWSSNTIFKRERLMALLSMNIHIFIRTLCLIFTFVFFTVQGAALGSTVLATNAVLLNFHTFMAFALDGFAHTAETMVGKALGANNQSQLNQAIMTTAFWSLIIAACFSVFYALFGSNIVQLITDISSIQRDANDYLPWVSALPLISFWSFMLDGIFIGALLTREMRNTMLLSTMIFLVVFYTAKPLGNHGLWLAMTCFMIARGLSMAVIFRLWYYQNK
ncbi:MAG: MATE family efflux transporter [Methylococcaceae bacterium]